MNIFMHRQQHQQQPKQMHVRISCYQHSVLPRKQILYCRNRELYTVDNLNIFMMVQPKPKIKFQC